MIENAESFLAAIKEVTSTEYDADACDFLNELQRGLSNTLTLAGATGERRDRIIFFDGLLKGVQLRLARDRVNAEYEANEMGIDVHTGTPVRKSVGH